MKPIPPDQIVAALSDDLQDLLVREAYIRKWRESLSAGLPERREKLASLQQTRPSFLAFRGREAKEDFEATGQKLRDEVDAWERALAASEVILAKCEKIIAAELAQFFEAQSPEFRDASAAHRLLPEWEQAVVLFQTCLKQFIAKLGVARNQMSSAYGGKAGAFSAGAKEAFAAALAAARNLETEGAIPNGLARKHRELLRVDPAPGARVPPDVAVLPYFSNLAVTKRVAELPTATLDEAQTRLRALLEEYEKMHLAEVPAQLEGLAAIRAAHEANHRRHVGHALAEIRAQADESVDPAQMEPVWKSMEARFVSLTG